MRLPHYAVLSVDETAQLQPFKQWFRTTQNVPKAALMTTHQMRNYMAAQGWHIRQTDGQVLIMQPGAETLPGPIAETEEPDTEETTAESSEASLFAVESHLRDYLKKNLNSSLKSFPRLDDAKSEYATDVGFIDLLAKDAEGNYYIFEFKLRRGADVALGQLLRYMGWCSKHLAEGRKVFGVILAAEISDKLRYAVLNVPNVTLLEYELQIRVKPVDSV